MFYGLLDLPWWGYLVYTALSLHVTNIAITLFLHRGMAHRALDLHPIISHPCRFVLWATTGIVTKQWTAIHRKHHAKCETEDDPHSPQILGLDTVLLYGAELYRKEARSEETLERYGQGTPDDWIERNVYTKRSALGIKLMFLTNLILLGVPGIAVWCVQMLWSPVAAAGVINGIGHFWGYRNFECPDAARNIVPIGIILCGEELHNNHHTFGTSAKFSVKPWEFDMGWMYITIFSKLGLARPKRIPPELAYHAEKTSIDIDTVTALFANRFAVMSHYARDVIVPVFSQARTSSQGAVQSLCSRTKALLIREECLIDAEGKKLLDRALEAYHEIRIVYDFKRRLQSLWDKTTATQKELLESVQTWAHEAEATGIASLRQFAQRLRNAVVL
jgi:stearoyl-CoA desaturase (delta-9 desaturase)